jgi:CRP/FNR family transcriptional regulator, cyclic AMP receptor protein
MEHDPGTAIALDASAFDELEFLSSDGEGKSVQAYRKNQSIFVQGESAAAVFYIQRGKVKLSATSVQGKDAVVGILLAGQFFGESCLNGHQNRVTSATAMEDCVLTAIDKMTMRAALQHELKLSDTFVTYLLTRISRVEDDLIDQLFNSSEKRLARLLLLLANYGQEGRPPTIDVTLSQETLAEMIGTTRSRVSSFMNKFRKLGYVSYVSFSANIKVHSSLLDSVLRDKPAIKHQG